MIDFHSIMICTPQKNQASQSYQEVYSFSVAGLETPYQYNTEELITSYHDKQCSEKP